MSMDQRRLHKQTVVMETSQHQQVPGNSDLARFNYDSFAVCRRAEIKILYVVLVLMFVGCRNAAVWAPGSPSEESEKSIFTYPTAGQTVNPFHMFTWNADPDAISYTLELGTARGARDV